MTKSFRSLAILAILLVSVPPSSTNASYLCLLFNYCAETGQNIAAPKPDTSSATMYFQEDEEDIMQTPIYTRGDECKSFSSPTKTHLYSFEYVNQTTCIATISLQEFDSIIIGYWFWVGYLTFLSAFFFLLICALIMLLTPGNCVNLEKGIVETRTLLA